MTASVHPEFDDHCVFCRIARGDFGTPPLAESPNAVAFRDIDPKAPTHVLLVPKRHIPDLSSAVDKPALLGEILVLAAAVAQQEGVESGGYRVLTNSGPDAGQTVFHLHFHLLGGKPLSAGLG